MKWKNKNIVEIKDNSKLSTIEFEFAMWASFVEIENCFCAFQHKLRKMAAASAGPLLIYWIYGRRLNWIDNQ